MSPPADDTAKEEVRARTSLREIVSRYLTLKQAGRRFVGLCPFHSEKTPSFGVNDDLGFYHCFGCGESGDVFSFLMHLEGLSFPEALEQLAREAGVELPERGGPRQKGQIEERERLHTVNRAASEFFERCLWESAAGSEARAYLERRQVARATAESFHLGYAPRNGLARFLENRQLRTADARTVGLLGDGRTGETYDRFRHRLMFPIADSSGQVIAFGGRALQDDAGPKYLNSPESPVFHKSRTLFGLGRAREAIRARGRILVVEGYMDAIALAEHDFAEVVAPLGTALTAEQASLLRRYAEEIVIVFDGDEAGLRAAARSFAVFADVGVFPEVVFLPNREDPDTFVRTQGREAFEALLGAKIPLVDHYLGTLAPAGAGLAAKKRAAESVQELLGRLRDPIFRGMLARRASERLGVPESEISPRRNQGRTARPEPVTSAAERPGPPEQEIGSDEAFVLELLIVAPEIAGEIAESATQLFRTEPARKAYDALRSAGTNPASAGEHLPRGSRDRIARALVDEAARGEVYGDPRQILQDCLARSAMQARAVRDRTMRDRIREAEVRGDFAAIQELLREKQRSDR